MWSDEPKQETRTKRMGKSGGFVVAPKVDQGVSRSLKERRSPINGINEKSNMNGSNHKGDAEVGSKFTEGHSNDSLNCKYYTENDFVSELIQGPLVYAC